MKEKKTSDLQKRADEISLLYQLGISLASGKDLFTTLFTLQNEILKLIQADSLFVAIYNEVTDVVDYPIFFEAGRPQNHPSRHLSENPGLTGAVLFNNETLYLADMMTNDAQSTYLPVDDNDFILHTFLGIPLAANEKMIGVLSVQSTKIDAYSKDQIHLMENVAVQAALAIDKARLLDQLQQELNERAKVEADLRERESILEVITFAAEEFLKTIDWRANINLVLERLGETIKASHAYLFEHQFDIDGIEYSHLKYEWTAPGFISDFDNPTFQKPHSLHEEEESTDKKLRQGEVFIGNSSKFPLFESERLNALGVKAMMEAPLFVNGSWWGTFGFDDMLVERDWSPAEVDALKITAGILGAAIQREKAESAVRESEQIYRRAIEAADAIPYYLDYVNNRYTFMGEGILEITGYSAAEMTPATWDKLNWQGFRFPRGSMAHLTHEEADQLTEKGILRHWECDYRIINRHGQIRWVSDSCIQIRDKDDVRIAVIGILKDITESKLTEAKLLKRESMLESVTFAAEQFLKTADWRETIDAVLARLGTEFNASHAYLFEKHMSANGVLLNSLRYEWVAAGQNSDMSNPIYQNAPVHESGFERYYSILNSGKPFVGNSSFFTEQEKEQMSPTGIKAMLEMRIVVDGRQWGTIGFDEMVNEREWTSIEVDVITVAANVLGAAIKRQLDKSALQNELDQRKLLIAELEQRGVERQRLLDFSSELLSTIDINEGFKIIHRTLNDLIHHDIFFPFWADEAAQVLHPVEANEKNGFNNIVPQNWIIPFGQGIIGDVARRQQAECVNNSHLDPRSIYPPRYQQNNIHEHSIYLPIHSGKKLIGMLGLLRNTNQPFTQAEFELAQFMVSLAELALNNARMFSELELKNAELERFTYTVSHDLRSPLVTIKGFLGYLEEDAKTGNLESFHRDMLRVNNAADRMDALLKDLLKLSRVGRLMNKQEEIGFEDLVKEALENVDGIFQKRQVTLQIQANLPRIYGDRQRLVEVLQNLLDNAAKYCGERPDPQVEVGKLDDDENGQLVFYVKDNGIGIDPEYHERVFGLFNKLDANSEGTGIGLSLVKRIIEVHGGNVWLVSELGKGSTFFFSLPPKHQI